MNKRKDLNNYHALFAFSRETQTLKGIESMLHWDQDTHMPPNSIEIRSKQNALLDTIIHKKQTSKVFGSLLKKLINLETGKILATSLSPEKKVAIKEWHRTYVKLIRLPNTFVKDFAALTSEAKHAWGIARQENNFLKFKPFLERIVVMCQKKAELLKYNKHPYDALLDEYEPGWTTQEIEQLFLSIKEPLMNLLALAAKKPKVNDDFLFGSFNKDKQLGLSHLLLKKMGYDLNCGRLDLTIHPFTINFHPTDVRLATAIHPLSLMSNIFATIHEAGHGIYELGLPKEQFGSPLCEAISSGVHESQSRLWETQLGQCLPFWHYFFPLLKKEFPRALNKVTLKKFLAAINKVTPGPIRIEADEVSYNLHIILRFEIEKALIEGTLLVKDLPEVWNSKMKEYLNVVVKNNVEGCLQDIHWSMGAFGYFPTYALGNLYAAQFFETFKKQHPNWEKEVASGNLIPIKQWLHKNIYQYGKLYSSQALIKKITGSKLTTSYFIEHLYARYQNKDRTLVQ
ncbi:MAG: carboxypeptidase M32 [archaeon]